MMLMSEMDERVWERIKWECYDNRNLFHDVIIPWRVVIQPFCVMMLGKSTKADMVESRG
jgi:hypothetical protein